MTVFWIVLAAIIAILIALFQYGYLSKKNRDKRKPWFALLRAATVFCIILLLVLPAFQSFTYNSVKPVLAVLVDNSRSIDNLKESDAVLKTLRQIESDDEISDRFEVAYYQWSSELNSLDSLDFTEGISNHENSIRTAQEIHRGSQLAMVMLTDGNQTAGRSLAYAQVDPTSKLYPILYGDTTSYEDILIDRINVNKYSFLNNKFPVEVFVNYDGDESVQKEFAVYEGNSKLYSQLLEFDDANRSQQLNFNLKSSRVGLKNMRAIIDELENERNTKNNSQSFVVEVIDQETKVLIYAAYPHPDVGVLKKAIESNEQRQVDIVYDDPSTEFADYNFVIFYGVGNAFAKAYNQTTSANINTWLITGQNANLTTINQLQDSFTLPRGSQIDEVQPLLNTLYRPFDLEAFDYDDYPPVSVPYGEIIFNVPYDVIALKQISGIETDMPFWFSYEKEGNRRAVTAAAGLWRWRSQSFLDNKDFRNFDDLINSQVQYLASNQRRSRIEIDTEPFYYQNSTILITARYLDKNYVFDDKAVINLKLKSDQDDTWKTRPLILSGNVYELDLSGLSPGVYDWQVQVEDETLKKSGRFEVIAFDIEAQAYGASVEDLKQLVGEDNLYYSGDWEKVRQELLDQQQFTPVRQQRSATSNLIDFEYLLAVLFILLAAEWFLRKYNGLI
jgi:hypothetical protein